MYPKLLEEFILKESKDRVVLVYCDKTLPAGFSDQGIDLKVVNDVTESSSLRALDDKASNGLHRIQVVTEPSLVKGTEFRAPANGICLIVAKSFDCK